MYIYQGNSRELKGIQGNSRKLKGTHGNSRELKRTQGNSRNSREVQWKRSYVEAMEGKKLRKRGKEVKFHKSENNKKRENIEALYERLKSTDYKIGYLKSGRNLIDFLPFDFLESS